MRTDYICLNIRPSPVGRGALAAFGLISLIYLILSFSKIVGNSFDSRGWSVQCSLAMCMWLISYLAATKLYFKTVYLYTTVFLFCLLLFHYGLIFQDALGLLRGPVWPTELLYWVDKAAWTTGLACASLGLGVTLAGMVSKQKIVSSAVAQQRYNKIKSFSSKYYVGLFLASIALIVTAILLSGNIFRFSRFELFFGNHPGLRFIGVFTMVFPTAISLFVLAPRSSLKQKGVFVIAVFCILLLMLTGYRSIALFPLFVGAVSWVKMGNKIPTLIALSLAFITLLSISVVGFLRHQGSYESFDGETLSASFEQADISKSLSTMGQSVGVLAHTIRLIPEKEVYRWGRTYWLYVKKAIPNIGSESDGGDSREALYQKITSDKGVLLDLIPSDWATYWILPTQFRTGGGVGFSAVGEPYMNFGPAGVIIYFFLLGMFLCNFDRKDIRYNPRWFIFASCFYWYLVVTVRNDFGNFFKPAIFLIIIMLAWKYFSKFLPKA